ncbi:MAG TPA: O-antigen ligase family protein, partial [Pseudolabrys sp.]|nr:O-antigen ligase family protein [Pseudolabrys sp.]
MITAEDAATILARPRAAAPVRPHAAAVPHHPAPGHAAPTYAPAPALAIPTVLPFRERLLLIVIYITVLASSIAFVEPSPHDALMGVLAVVCLIAGVRFDRKLAVMLLLLVLWNTGGIISLANVPGQEKTIQYAATSVYLAIAALLWACILAEKTLQRMAPLRAAYIVTAVAAAICGILGYFNVAGLGHLFTDNDRAMGAFKDPNVFGPFLIWPALVLMERMLVRRISIVDLGALAIIVGGLLLSFSRGAWTHFALSGLIMIALSFLCARKVSTRMRIFVMSAIAVALLVAFVVVLLSIPAIHKMFEVRAHLLQSYDVGQGGRFRLQEQAVTEVLRYFNGMGPFGFASTHAQQQHNVYLQAFLVYGWVG